MSRSTKPPQSRKLFTSKPRKHLLDRRTVLWGTAAIVPVGAVWFWDSRRSNAASIAATLYKNPQCTCCESYASYLDGHGFDVKVIPSNDLELINQQHSVPTALDGCHTTLIGQYVVVGHVPAEVVQRLLREKPDVIGISIPGMPTGTPGMDGPRQGPLTIYAFSKSGQSVFATL